mgnify:CR=1 FL=1
MKEIFALLDPSVSIGLLTGWLRLVHLKVILRVFKLKISLFDKCRDLFKLVIGVFRVMEKDSVEHFSQVAVEVLRYVSSNLLALSELSLDALRSEEHTSEL